MSNWVWYIYIFIFLFLFCSFLVPTVPDYPTFYFTNYKSKSFEIKKTKGRKKFIYHDKNTGIMIKYRILYFAITPLWIEKKKKEKTRLLLTMAVDLFEHIAVVFHSNRWTTLRKGYKPGNKTLQSGTHNKSNAQRRETGSEARRSEQRWRISAHKIRKTWFEAATHR